MGTVSPSAYTYRKLYAKTARQNAQRSNGSMSDWHAQLQFAVRCVGGTNDQVECTAMKAMRAGRMQASSANLSDPSIFLYVNLFYYFIYHLILQVNRLTYAAAVRKNPIVPPSWRAGHAAQSGGSAVFLCLRFDFTPESGRYRNPFLIILIFTIKLSFCLFYCTCRICWLPTRFHLDDTGVSGFNISYERVSLQPTIHANRERIVYG